MNYWLISDTHFSHERMNEWGERPAGWQEKLYSGLSRIPKDDTLIHLGDVCIGDDVDVHENLFSSKGCTPDRAILVRGNHDKKSFNWYNEHGWDFVCDGLELVYMGHYLHLSHRPARPHNPCTWNIHGHTHGNMHRSEEYRDFYSNEYHIDISPEIVGYDPVRLDTLLKKIKV